MQTYELTYIISPEITSQEAESKAKEIESLIQSKEGVIIKQSTPVAKTLSYQIQKRASGFLGIIEFQLEPEHLIEIKKTLAKDGSVVRNMITIKTTPKVHKERRTKKAPSTLIEKVFGIDRKESEKTEYKTAEEEKPASAKTPAGKEKVELKDIEQQLEEILGE